MESKWIGRSLTFWGTAVTVASTVLPVIGPMLGWALDAAAIADIGKEGANIINHLSAIIGSAAAIIGRFRAKTAVTLLP